MKTKIQKILLIFAVICCWATCVKKTSTIKNEVLQGPIQIYLKDKDISTIKKSIEDALQTRKGDNLVLYYLKGDINYLEGDFESAAESFFKVIDLASKGKTPKSSILSYLSISALNSIWNYIPYFNEKIEESIERNIDGLYRNYDDAYFSFLTQKINLLRRKGMFEEAKKAEIDGGCIQNWVKVGPFGKTDLLGFDTVFPPEVEVPWKKAYQIDESKGKLYTQKTKSNSCWTYLGSETGNKGGTFYGISTVNIGKETKIALKLTSFDPTMLQIDGTEIIKIDRRNNIYPNSITVKVILSEGIHFLLVKISSRNSSPQFSLILKESAEEENRGINSKPFSFIDYDPSFLPVAPPPENIEIEALPDATDDLTKILVVDMHIALGSIPLAKPLIDELAKKYPHSITIKSRQLFVNAMDATVPFNLRINRAKLVCLDLIKESPQIWIPYLYMSLFEEQIGRIENAAQIIEEGMRASPKYPAFYERLADIYQNLGWNGEAKDILEKGVKVLKGTCKEFYLKYEIAEILNSQDDMEKNAEMLHSCDATSRIYDGILSGREKWDKAKQVMLKLMEDNPEDRWLTYDTALTSFKSGDFELYEKLLRKLNSKEQDSQVGALKLADFLFKKGKNAEAKELLFDTITKTEGPPVLLYKKIAEIDGYQYLFHFRRSFEEAVASFNSTRSTQYQNTPSIEVLDHVTHRIFEDGSAISRYHSVRKIVTREGVEKNGEFTVPEGAVILKIRTVKPDGTSYEPEKIYGKPSLSYPMLEPGDFTETEWVSYQPPSHIFPGGTMLERWYFRVPDMVLHRSEMFLIAPSGMKVDFNTRGNLPNPKVWNEGDLTIYSWTVMQSPHIKYETNSPNLDEFLPSIQVNYKTSWEDFFDWIRDLFADTMTVTPEMKEALLKIISGVTSDDNIGKAKAIYRWVCDEIEDEEGLTTPVSYIFHQKRGDRIRLLYALLKAANVPVELHLAETIYSDKTPSNIPDFKKFTHFIIKVGDDWLLPAIKKAYYGFIPFQLYNQNTIRILPEYGKGHISGNPIENEKTEINLKIEVNADGTCKSFLQFLFNGPRATILRNQLRNIPAGDIENQVESNLLAPDFTGSTLEKLEILDLDEPSSKLTIRIEFEMPAQHGPYPGTFSIGPILKNRIATRWAGLPSRNFPLLIDENLNTTSVIEIDGKDIWKIVMPPQPKVKVTILKDFLFSQEVELNSSKSKLVIKRNLKIPIGRISPEDYGSFLSFASKVDETEGGVYLLEPAH